MNFHRITIAFFSFSILSLGLLCKEDAPIKSSGEVSPNATEGTALQAGFLIMDGVYNTELTAPYDIFQHTKFREGIVPIRVFTVAEDTGRVTTFEGLSIIPDYSFESPGLPHMDILVVPSAEHHLDSDLENAAMIAFVREHGGRADAVLSLCDGAFVLAKAGLLDSVASTTFPGDLETYREMFPHLDIRDSAYLVHDGKMITSAGGARSFDAALYFCEFLYGNEIAKTLAKGLVIDWDPAEIRAEISDHLAPKPEVGL